MNKYKFLKQIYAKGNVKPINTALYSKDNAEVQMVLKLKKEKLVDYRIMVLTSTHEHHMFEYWITDKGKEYVDKRSLIKFSEDKTEHNLVQILVNVLVIVIASIIIYYFGFK